MMKLYITRYKDGPNKDCTLGKFRLVSGEGEPLQYGYTLEPSGPDTVTSNQNKRIPVGAYSVNWFNSPKYKTICANLYNDNVPASRRILIHAGNYPKDTLGCILLGNATNNTDTVFDSKAAIKIFDKHTGQKNMLQVIIDSEIS